MIKSPYESKADKDLLQKMEAILLPEKYLEDFEVTDTENKSVITLVLKGKDAVQNGNCNPIEIFSHSFLLKTYISPHLPSMLATYIWIAATFNG